MKGEEPLVCIGCDEKLTTENILLTCSDLTETRVKEAFYSSVTMCFISRYVIKKGLQKQTTPPPPPHTHFLKEINIFSRI